MEYELFVVVVVKSVGQAWYRDCTVTVVELPEPVCRQLVLCLAQNTSSLPPSLRRADDDFSVSCVPFQSVNLFAHITLRDHSKCINCGKYHAIKQ